MDTQRNSRGRKRGSYPQADRLARMMRALASRAVTINELADEFEITRRQVYRDLAEIEDEGHPLERSDGSSEKTWQLPLAGNKGVRNHRCKQLAGVRLLGIVPYEKPPQSIRPLKCETFLVKRRNPERNTPFGGLRASRACRGTLHERRATKVIVAANPLNN